jgi:hypothetical protein
MFVLSRDSVASEVCGKEVSHALALNKRFAPIVCRRADDNAIPEALRRLNFIFSTIPANSTTASRASSTRCKPTSAGSASTPITAKRRGNGRRRAAPADYCCAHPRWTWRSIGFRRGLVVRQSPTRKPKNS